MTNSLKWARELHESLAAEIARLLAKAFLDGPGMDRVILFRQQLTHADALIAYLQAEDAAPPHIGSAQAKSALG